MVKINIKKIEVKNFRLLKDFKLDLEKDISVIVGKNNCGKTSLLYVLNKFIGDSCNNFSYSDFNIEFKDDLYKKIINKSDDWNENGIYLNIYIGYDENDDLSNIADVMLDLDPENNVIVLGFQYSLNKDKFKDLSERFDEYRDRHKNLHESNEELFEKFVSMKHKKYFEVIKKSYKYDKEEDCFFDDIYINLEKKKVNLNKIINFKFIEASRNVSNIDKDNTLSSLSSQYYEHIEDEEVMEEQVNKLDEKIFEADRDLSVVYGDLFEGVINKVKEFGGVKKDETLIKVISSLQRKELLKGNTKVVYEDNKYYLPESYNGLGYLNLISMILKIEILLSEFRKDKDTSAKPADINLLFIEEPEAHTHPQMQYIFIKNIKKLLSDGSGGNDGNGKKKKFNLQTIMTTHSSHIVSECDFDDIKYFKKIKNKESTYIQSKNLKDLEVQYQNKRDGKSHFKFLKQYLTLNRSEIFFADKAIFIEGDTERILLPAMMKKIDQEKCSDEEIPLLSQNISLIEVGNYSQVFDEFIDFIGLKSLIITDIDSAKQEIKKKDGKPMLDKDGSIQMTSKACPVSESISTTNGAIKHYYNMYLKNINNSIKFLKNLPLKKIPLIKVSNEWEMSYEGKLLITYQVEEKNYSGIEYNARSFEDAFFHINRNFIINNKEGFKRSLRNIDFFDKRYKKQNRYCYDSFKLAEKCINKKTSFAMDVLLNSKSNGVLDYSNWSIPKYIEDGLLWLRKD